MDEFQVEKPGGQNADKPIPFDDGLSVSHSPLNLGGGGSSDVGEAEEAQPRPIAKETGKKASWCLPP